MQFLKPRPKNLEEKEIINSLVCKDAESFHLTSFYCQ